MEYFDKRRHHAHFVKARAVVLAASACESARLLLNSGRTPQGLANSSGQVGRNLMDTTGTNITGHIPALEGRPRYNEDGIGGGACLYPLLALQGAGGRASSISRAAIITSSAAASPRRAAIRLAGMEDGYGASLKEDARRYYGSFSFRFTVRGEMIPNADSYCEIDPRGEGQVRHSGAALPLEMVGP